MTITGEDTDRGQVLLLAAAPRRSRRRLLDPELGVTALATVPTRTLLNGWTGPADVVQIVDPGEPQSVLARLRSAAAVHGPLLVYVCGQLIRDHRQHRIHLALAQTTENTIRYTALPWEWIGRELAARRPNTTTVVLDVLADPSCLPMAPDDLQLPEHVARWGVVAPPARRGPWQAPAYTQALAQLLRTAPAAQHLAQLHPLAAGQAGLDQGTVVLGPPPAEPSEMPRPRTPHPSFAQTPPMPTAAPAPVDQVPDLRPAIAEAMRAGHHHAAAELAAQWERQVLRAHGRESALMGDVLEVQATAAAASGAEVRAAERWIATARHRLLWSPPHSEPVQLAVRNAHSVWNGLDEDEPQAEQLGRLLAEVLQEAGAERALAAVEQRLTELQQPPTYRPPAGWTTR